MTLNINKLSFEVQLNKTQELQPQISNQVNVKKENNETNGINTKISSEKNKIKEDELQKTLKKLNKNDDIIKRGLRFEKVDDLEEWVVKVFNTDTGEVIRQIPSEEAVKIAKGIEEIIGTIFDEKV